MAFRQLSTKSVDGVCDLCCHESIGWAIGPCDHPVCCLCATRMRLLCGKYECAVCRSEMDKVVFATTVQPFKSRKLSDMPCDKENSVYFQNNDLMEAYYNIQRFVCPECNVETFGMRKLNIHTRRMHGLHYCDICLDHLKLFPCERKLYSQLDLMRHYRKGDPDDMSHKGHALCKFCNQRYFDKDQLYSHLHKTHFWCHFCEGDGKQDYYVDYVELKKHFKSQHYLCEQDDCAHKDLEAAFKSKIDFQAHTVAMHSQSMSKSQSKQKKQIEQIQLGFRYDRHYGSNGGHDMDQRCVDRRLPGSHRKKEDSEVSKAIALSLADSEKSASKNSTSKKSDISSQEPPMVTIVPDPPPGFKKKRSSNPSDSQESKSITLVSDPPPGFKKKQNSHITETDFPAMIKPPEALSAVPLLSYGNLLGGINKQDFPVLSVNPTEERKVVAPPPGFVKKATDSSSKPGKKESFVLRLKHMLGDDEKFEQFKVWSSEFRRSDNISAEEYENNCCMLFGDQQWNGIFDELVATLPDEQGRDNLIKAHQDRNTGLNGSCSAAAKKSKAKKRQHSDRPIMAWGNGNSAVGDRTNDDLYPPLSSNTVAKPPPVKWGYKVAVK